MSQTPPPPPGNQPPGNYPPNTQPGYGGPPQPMSPQDEKLWSTLTHIGGILFSFVAPLIAYLVLKDRGPFVRAHTATALNFQLTALIAWVGISVLGVVTFGIASFLYLPLAVVVILFPILAAVAANRGQFYTYPVTIPFVR